MPGRTDWWRRSRWPRAGWRRHGVRSGRPPRRRHALGGAHRSRSDPRRLLGDPSARRRISGVPGDRRRRSTQPTRPGVDPFRGAAGPSARRGPRRGAAPLGRRHRDGPRPRCVGVSAVVRAAGRRRLRAHRRAPVALDRSAEASTHDGSLRRGRDPSGAHARQARFRHRRGPSVVRRPRGPLVPLPRFTDHRGLRVDARRPRTRRRLAVAARWLAADRRRARRRARRPRRDGRMRAPDRLARRVAAERRGAARRHAAPGARLGRRRVAEPIRQDAHQVPLRARRVQGRLGARRADPVDERRLRTGRDGPPRRNAR